MQDVSNLAGEINDRINAGIYDDSVNKKFQKFDVESRKVIIGKILVNHRQNTINYKKVKALFQYLGEFSGRTPMSIIPFNFDLIYVYTNTSDLDLRILLVKVLVKLLQDDQETFKQVIQPISQVLKECKTRENELLLGLFISILEVDVHCFSNLFLKLIAMNRPHMIPFIAHVIAVVSSNPSQGKSVFAKREIITYLIEKIRENTKKEEQLSRILLAFLVVAMDSVDLLNIHMEELFRIGKRLIYVTMPGQVGHSDLKHFILTYLRLLHVIFKENFMRKFQEWSNTDVKVRQFLDTKYMVRKESEQVERKTKYIGIKDKKRSKTMDSSQQIPQSFDESVIQKNVIMDLLNIDDATEELDVGPSIGHHRKVSPSSELDYEESYRSPSPTSSFVYDFNRESRQHNKKASVSFASQMNVDVVPEFVVNLNSLLIEQSFLAEVERKETVLENLLIYERYLTKTLLLRLNESESRSNVKSELIHTKRKLDRAETRNTTFQNELKDLTGRLRENEAHLKKWNQDTTDMITYWRGSYQNESKSKMELLEKVTSLEDEKQELNKKIKDIEAELSHEKEELHRLERIVHPETEENVELSHDLLEKEWSISPSVSEKDLSSLTEKASIFDEDTKELTREVEMLRKKLAQANLEIEAHNSIASQAKTSEDAARRLKIAENENRKLLSQLDKEKEKHAVGMAIIFRLQRILMQKSAKDRSKEFEEYAKENHGYMRSSAEMRKAEALSNEDSESVDDNSQQSVDFQTPTTFLWPLDSTKSMTK